MIPRKSVPSLTIRLEFVDVTPPTAETELPTYGVVSGITAEAGGLLW